MGVTAIVEVRNFSTAIATLQNFETPSDTADGKGVFQPGETRKVSIWIPQCTNAADFPKKHIQVTFQGGSFSIWQADLGGADRVRLSKNGQFSNPGEEIGGFSWVGAFLRAPVILGPFVLWLGNGDRGLFITDTGMFLLPQEMVDALSTVQGSVKRAAYTICGEAMDDSIESVPRLSATCFSMAGIPSDAFRRGKPGARFLYRDSGKRYEFSVKKTTSPPPGASPRFLPLSVLNPDGSTTQLTQAITYNHFRKFPGENVPLPEFDLIAADGGRVFAKQRGLDRFFFATLDEMFIHADAAGHEFSIPSVYFKLDPEFNHANASVADLLAHLQGNFARHPATRPYPIYKVLLRANLLNLMMVSVQPFKWHQLDVRPPAGVQALAECAALPLITDVGLATLAAGIGTLLILARPFLLRALTLNPDLAAPPPFGPAKPKMKYCPADSTFPVLSPVALTYEKVLDIGVGHVHLHQQYELITGGEIQPLRIPTGNPVNDAMKQYQYLNGPVRDGDGYIDGTCNYYALVQFKKNIPRGNDAFALLYTDEQSYFSGRWRIVHPTDFRAGLSSLVSKLSDDSQRDPASQLFHFDQTKYWCPFRTGLIGPTSRLAVSAQVLLVSGDRDIEPNVIYSINFSWATMDRSWRWRKLSGTPRFFPTDTQPDSLENEVIATDQANCFFPQTLRLRGDMTIHIKGTGPGSGPAFPVGRWCQKYLPPSNTLDPVAPLLAANTRPAASADRAWQFVPESLFQRADHFSHFGVYDVVDSRCQYYPLQVAADAAAILQGANPGPWTDDQKKLAVFGQRQFSWDDLQLPDSPVMEAKRPPSLFNPATMLKIVRHGVQWIAMYWDKRDDDLMPLSVPIAGLDVLLSQGSSKVQVRFMPNVLLEGPPAVQKAFFWIIGGQATLGYTQPLAGPPYDNVARVRMAALGDLPGQVVPILDFFTAGNFKLSHGYYQHQWTPTATELALLNTYASNDGTMRSGTSVWFEDMVGHVARPEELHWTFPPMMNATMIPAEVPVGVQVSVTVHATDLVTGNVLHGKVLIDDAVFATDQPFNFTFIRKPQRVFDPVTKTWEVLNLPSRIFVVVEGYPETEVPLKFSSLRVWVEQPALSFGVPVQVTVHAADGETQTPVTGRVKINNVDVQATNTAFSFNFSASPAPSGVVSAPGYPDTPIFWPPFRPAELMVSLQPAAVPGQAANYVVHATDANSRLQVEGVVTIGAFTTRANAVFSYTFVVQRIRIFDPETRTWTIQQVLPTINVAVPGYPPAQLTPELPDPSGTK